MDSKMFVVDLSPEVVQLLTENQIDLLAELKKQGLDVTRGSRPPELPQPSGTKSVELLILASAVATPFVASAIARVVDAVGRNRRAVVTSDPMSTSSPVVSSAVQRESEHGITLSFLGLKVELSDKFNTPQ
jgi:hypothetical protein